MHDGHLSYTREAAHSVNRIIHAKGDATGHEIVRALKEHVKTKKHVTRIENTFAIDLIVRNNKVYGIKCIDEITGELKYYYTKAIIIATGGGGRIYTRTTNPEVSTGDGIAMAFRAGATIKDMEFFQFHPTGLHKKGCPAFLLSESMRGEGAVLRNKDGYRFCFDYHKDGELAPRDIVARAIFFEMIKTDYPNVYMDLTHLDSNFLKNRFPKIYTTLLQYDLDITKDLIPVSPAAHYQMGGIETDLWGRTSVEGLYACGEAACTGVHGANRLASNSLLEGVVFGARSAKAAVMDCSDKKIEISEKDLINENASGKCDIKLSEVQDVLWKYVSVIRNEKGLKSALESLTKFQENFLSCKSIERKIGEFKNVITVGKLITLAALERKGSRGSHFRDDYPEKIKENWHIVFKNGQFNPVIQR
jgi:L-aspartate oxidase